VRSINIDLGGRGVSELLYRRQHRANHSREHLLSPLNRPGDGGLRVSHFEEGKPAPQNMAY
jgi:hypothetical protein